MTTQQEEIRRGVITSIYVTSSGSQFSSVKAACNWTRRNGRCPYDYRLGAVVEFEDGSEIRFTEPYPMTAPHDVGTKVVVGQCWRCGRRTSPVIDHLVQAVTKECLSCSEDLRSMSH